MSLPGASTSAAGGIDPREFQEFEGPLIELAQRSGGDLRKLLTAFFGFLHRRTDFYLIPPEDGSSNMGFKEGEAEKVLLAAFRQFPLRRVPSKQQVEEAQKKKKPQPKSALAPSDEKKSPTTESIKKAPMKGVSGGTATTTAKATIKKTEEHEIIRRTEEGLQIPVGNGGSTDRYKWTQTLEECSVLVAIPEGIRGRDLDVSIKTNSLSIRSKKPIGDAETEPRTFVDGELTEKIVPDESTWTLEGGVLIAILYKQQKKFWATIIVGDDKIDTSLVDSSRHIGTYDESTQAQIRKIMFDQKQQAAGLPTSDEIAGQTIVPPLPPGVEYIDQDILEERTKEKD